MNELQRILKRQVIIERDLLIENLKEKKGKNRVFYDYRSNAEVLSQRGSLI
jgi:hypothetical protein